MVYSEMVSLQDKINIYRKVVSVLKVLWLEVFGKQWLESVVKSMNSHY